MFATSLFLTLGAASQPAASTAEVTNETVLLAGAGTALGETSGGLAASVTALHRVHFLELGVEAYGAAAFSAIGSLGGLAGVHLGSRFSMSALLSGGVHHYGGVGAGLLSDDPGVSGSVPYLGGRLLLGYSFGKQRRYFIGLSGSVEEDLERQRKSVTYVEEPWLFGGEPYTATSEHTIGQTTWTGLLMFGRKFDLARY